MAPRKGRSLEVIPPAPIDDEERPLLDEEHPDHGTITEHQAHEEHLDGESQDTIIEEPSTSKLLLTILPAFVGSFFAAAGMASFGSISEDKTLMLDNRLDHCRNTRIANKHQL